MDTLKDKKVVVTGGAGFIGSHIVDGLLKAGANVFVLDNFITGKRENLKHCLDKITLVEGSITDLDTVKRVCEGATYVIHQAAIPSVPRSLENPVASHEANATGTLNVLIAARDAGVKRVVYASSSSVYGLQETMPNVETMERRPLSPYAAQKALGEVYAEQFYTLFGLETVGLRYFNVFGERQDPNSEYSAVIPKFIKLIKEGKKITIFGDGEQSRDFTYVQNVVRGNLLACTVDAPVAGEVINVACHGQISLNALVEKIGAILNVDIQSSHAEGRHGEIKDSFADIDKAKNLLGYNVEVSFDEGLQKTIDSIN